MRFATKAIHVGQEPDPRTGAVTPPLYLTSTYSRKTQDEYAYARSSNPTREALQKSLAGLEAAKYALSFSSGMGAITTSLTLLKKGDHVVVTDDCYGGVYRIFTRIMSNYGIESSFVDLRDLVDAEDAFRPETRMLWTESPTNPLMKVVDLRELAVIAKAHDAISVCDNTFASPALQNPLALGVDLVVHSTTKYIGGPAELVRRAAQTPRGDRAGREPRRSRVVDRTPGIDDPRKRAEGTAGEAGNHGRSGALLHRARRRSGFNGRPGASARLTTRAGVVMATWEAARSPGPSARSSRDRSGRSQPAPLPEGFQSPGSKLV